MQSTAAKNPWGPAPTALHAAAPARWTLLTGRILTALVAVFLLVDGVLRVAGFAPYVEGTVKYGYAESLAPAIGMVLIVSTVLYLVPRTAVLGAILLTGYLGGAAASHVIAGESFVFPVVFGAMAWGALYLRDSRLRALLPLGR